MRKNYTFLIFVLTICSCIFSNEASPEKLVSWYHNHMDIVSRKYKHRDMQVSCVYLSNGYQAARGKIDKDDIKNYFNSISNTVSFILLFKNNGAEIWQYDLKNEAEYYSRLSHLNTDFVKDIKLVLNESDTLNCAFAHLERTYGLGENEKVQISFTKESSTQVRSLKVLYNDKLFRLGRINFYFSKNDIQKIPTLKL